MRARLGLRSARRILIALLLPAILVGCGSARLYVPEGREVRLLQDGEPASVRETRRVWFWLWGNAAISDESPRPEIEKHDLEEIRMTSKQTLLDTVINFIGGGVSIVCRTMVVEGNP